jgi:hypothetical protein
MHWGSWKEPWQSQLEKFWEETDQDFLVIEVTHINKKMTPKSKEHESAGKARVNMKDHHSPPYSMSFWVLNTWQSAKVDWVLMNSTGASSSGAGVGRNQTVQRRAETLRPHRLKLQLQWGHQSTCFVREMPFAPKFSLLMSFSSLCCLHRKCPLCGASKCRSTKVLSWAHSFHPCL